MFDDRGEIEWRFHVGPAEADCGPSWREIDRQLRRVAKRRAAVDAEELRWLALAESAQVHRHLGFASMLEYVERVLGHGPQAGKERLRVARALTEMPKMTAALEQGALVYTAVRELTRRATSETEQEWIEAARGNQGKLLISGSAPDRIVFEFDRWEQDSPGDGDTGPTWDRAEAT